MPVTPPLDPQELSVDRSQINSKSSQPFSSPKFQPKLKYNHKYQNKNKSLFIAGLILIFLVLGGIVSFISLKQRQDVRQQASEGVDGCNQVCERSDQCLENLICYTTVEAEASLTNLDTHITAGWPGSACLGQDISSLSVARFLHNNITPRYTNSLTCDTGSILYSRYLWEQDNGHVDYLSTSIFNDAVAVSLADVLPGCEAITAQTLYRLPNGRYRSISWCSSEPDGKEGTLGFYTTYPVNSLAGEGQGYIDYGSGDPWNQDHGGQALTLGDLSLPTECQGITAYTSYAFVDENGADKFVESLWCSSANSAGKGVLAYSRIMPADAQGYPQEENSTDWFEYSLAELQTQKQLPSTCTDMDAMETFPMGGDKYGSWLWCQGENNEYYNFKKYIPLQNSGWLDYNNASGWNWWSESGIERVCRDPADPTDYLCGEELSAEQQACMGIYEAEWDAEAETCICPSNQPHWTGTSCVSCEIIETWYEEYRQCMTRDYFNCVDSGGDYNLETEICDCGDDVYVGTNNGLYVGQCYSPQKAACLFGGEYGGPATGAWSVIGGEYTCSCMANSGTEWQQVDGQWGCFCPTNENWDAVAQSCTSDEGSVLQQSCENSGGTWVDDVCQCPVDMELDVFTCKYPGQVACEDGGGEWKEDFANSCKDICSTQENDVDCLDEISAGCNCSQPDECWDSTTQTCRTIQTTSELTEQELCETTDGIYSSASNSCLDLCGAEFGQCSTSFMNYGCDCGENRCWDPTNGCISGRSPAEIECEDNKLADYSFGECSCDEIWDENGICRSQTAIDCLGSGGSWDEEQDPQCQCPSGSSLTNGICMTTGDNPFGPTGQDTGTVSFDFKLAMAGVPEVERGIDGSQTIWQPLLSGQSLPTVFTFLNNQGDVFTTEVDLQYTIPENEAEAYYSAQLILANFPTGRYQILIKGPMHRRHAFCEQGQTYDKRCAHYEFLNITANSQDVSTYEYDFSDTPLDAGDLRRPPNDERDGLVNQLDYSFLVGCLSSTTDPACVARADLNYSGVVNNIDLKLLIDTLSNQLDDV